MIIQEENNDFIHPQIENPKMPIPDAQMSVQIENTQDSVQDNEFCRLCDQFQQKYGKMSWVNIVYVALIICIMIFVLSLLFSAPVYCWVLLLIFITIWIFRNRDINTGLFLLALFLFILLLSPSASETNPMIVLNTPSK